VFAASELFSMTTVRGGEIRLANLASSKDPKTKLLIWSSVSSGDQLTFSFDLQAQASVGLFVSVLRGPQTGSLRVLVNGQDVGEQLDLTFAREATAKLRIGQVQFQQGTNTITFVAMPFKDGSKIHLSLLEVSLDK